MITNVYLSTHVSLSTNIGWLWATELLATNNTPTELISIASSTINNDNS